MLDVTDTFSSSLPMKCKRNVAVAGRCGVEWRFLSCLPFGRDASILVVCYGRISNEGRHQRGRIPGVKSSESGGHETRA